ncbi:MAG: hypothetical protein J6T70_09790 [Bacteroidales bacterium]|nr:hypothetical protein [Bacteroidales bacterium]
MKRLLLATILAVSVALCYGQNFKDQMRGVLSDASKVCLSAATNEWFNKLDQSDKRRIESAINLCNKVEEMANYASNLRELVKNSQIPLPVGIKNDAGYNLVVSEIVHDNDSVATILMSCVIPLKSCILGFEGTFTITGKAGVCSPGKINMIAPVSFGKNIRVVFDKGTYAEFDCEGITKFHAKAVVEIDSTNLVFYDERDSITKQVPKFSTTLDFQEVNDFAFSLDQKVKFGFRNLKDWIFTLERLDFDNSEIVTSTNIKFPEGYFQSNEKNLWRGVSIGKSSLKFPKSFSKDSIKPTTVNCDYFIIDDNGFTLSANVRNMAWQLDESKPFAINVDNAEFRMLKNDIKKVAFDGEFNWKALGRFSRHQYEAYYNDASNEFDLKTNLGDSLVLNFICAELELNKASKLDLKIRNGKFLPSVTAHGKLTIKAGEKASALNIPQLGFENMYIGMESPYFKPGTWSLEGVATSKFAGMELQLNKLSFNNNSLNLDVDMQFGDIVRAGGAFHIYGDFKNFKFKEFQISRFALGYTSKTFSIDGQAIFEKNDPTYGNYFRGDVKVKLVDLFEVNATGLFGKVGGNKYFFADLMMENGGTLFLIPPAFNVYGIGGGVYRHMQQTSEMLPAGKTPSGIYYKPDVSVGFGFTAALKFGIYNKNFCDAKTMLEIQFNNNWGLNFVQFKGDAVFLNGNEKFGSIVSSANQYIQAVNKANQMSSTDGSSLPIPEIKGSYPLTASTLIKFNNTEKSFFTYLRAYLDLGLIHGKGDNNKLVDATAYFGPDKWYTYLGRPNDRCGIVADLGKLFHLDLNSYFMAGKIDARLPDPDARLKSLFSDSQWQSFQQRKSSPSLDNADGVAFGVGFATGLSVRPWPFFAELNVATGGEFLLANYGKNSHCKGSSSPLGIGGWYASAQLWAYLDAKLGIKVKFLRKERTFTIFDAAAGAILQGAGPNPFYFTGLVGCRYKVLGGLFKGTCSVKFEIGEPCEIVQEKGLLDQSIISSLTPDNGSSDVNVFVSPQMLLNVDCRNQMALEVNGQKNIYKVFVDYVKVYKFATGEELKGSISIDDEGLVVSFDPETALESETKYKMEAKVTFKQLVNGVWQTAKDPDGSEYVESMQTVFTSGLRPDHIDPDHIICSYPVDRMYNFYPEETTTGYICLDAVFDYLFLNVPEGYEQKLRLTTLNGQQQTASFSHFASNEVTLNSRRQRYEISFSLSDLNFNPQTIYTLEIVNLPLRTAQITDNVSTGYTITNGDSIRNISADGDLAQLETKQICKVDFRTSKYKKFVEKINSIDLDGNAYVDGAHLFMKNIFKGFVTDDFFDVYESQVWGNTNTLVYLNADLNNTDWYNKSTYKIVYDNYSAPQVPRDRAFGYPPSDAMTVFNPSLINHDHLTDNEIASGIPQGLSDDGMINYGIIFECHDDLKVVQDMISIKHDRGQRLSPDESRILNYSHPESYNRGNYPFTISYRLPGKGTVTSTIHKNYKY